MGLWFGNCDGSPFCILVWLGYFSMKLVSVLFVAMREEQEPNSSTKGLVEVSVYLPGRCVFVGATPQI